jgi:hypothetical protein
MKPTHGDGSKGESFEPTESSDEPVADTDKPKAAPAPGLPVSQQEYDRMKDAARHAPAPRVEGAQEDVPRSKESVRRNTDHDDNSP